MKKAFLIIFFMFLTACSSSSLSNVNYYILQNTDNAVVVEAEKITDIKTEKDLCIGVLPVTIPAYLNRAQIVLREPTSTKVAINEYHRWAEKLDEAIQRTLAIALDNDLAKENTSAVVLKMGFPIDYKLVVEVLAFEGALNGEAHIDAVWALEDREEILLEGHYKKSMPTGATYEELIEKQSMLVEALAGNIADAYREMKK